MHAVIRSFVTLCAVLPVSCAGIQRPRYSLAFPSATARTRWSSTRSSPAAGHEASRVMWYVAMETVCVRARRSGSAMPNRCRHKRLPRCVSQVVEEKLFHTAASFHKEALSTKLRSPPSEPKAPQEVTSFRHEDLVSVFEVRCGPVRCRAALSCVSAATMWLPSWRWLPGVQCVRRRRSHQHGQRQVREAGAGGGSGTRCLGQNGDRHCIFAGQADGRAAYRPGAIRAGAAANLYVPCCSIPFCSALLCTCVSRGHGDRGAPAGSGSQCVVGVWRCVQRPRCFRSCLRKTRTTEW